MSGRITGGKTGFVAAVNAAFASRCVNPAVRYSAARGFYAESSVHPAGADVLWEGGVQYWADTGLRSLRPSMYADVRREILRGVP